ncbi:MAG: hypothetical protein JEZ09_01820 [Salinivirgaceae bacterium]|nr:hypothetical protein [Salinivirgaceae bacterium]
MNPIFKKLHLPDSGPALVLNAPDEFLAMLSETKFEIHEEILDFYNYVQVFVQDEEEANDLVAEGISALEPGAYFWFCFPKLKSTNYETNLDEKLIVEILESFDMGGVTQVSLNDDWLAMRIKFNDEIGGDFDANSKGSKRMHDLYD